MALYLITGGAGFIGSHLTSALVERGDRVRVLDDLSSGKRSNLAHLEVGETGSGAPVELEVGDIVDEAACGRAMEGVSGVLHEAAQVSVPQSLEDPVRSYQVNVMGTLQLLEAARRAGVQRFVMAASSAAYGESPVSPKVEELPLDPHSPYASGKIAGEHLLKVYGRAHGIRTVCLRYFNVFGPRQADDSPYTGVIAIFVKLLGEGRAPEIHGDGEQTRDFTFVANAVAANLAALEADLEPGAVINVGGGESISINALYRELAGLMGRQLEPSYAPSRAGDVRHSLADLSRAEALLGYRPVVGWKEGLERTVAWYRERMSQEG